MTKNRAQEIITELRSYFPNPKCELEFNNVFELCVCVMLSAQTTDKRVNAVTKDLFKKYPNCITMMNASYDELYQMIFPLGLAKNKTLNLLNLSKMLHEEYSDIVPNTLEELVKLPGVGRKTANVILALGYNIPSIPVDTHLHRLAIRLGFINDGMSVVDAEESYKKYIPKNEWIDSHHLILLYGRYYCTSRNPKCDGCRLKKICKYNG